MWLFGFLALVLAISPISGCERKTDVALRSPGLYVAEGSGKRIDDMNPDDVIVIVNGDKIRKSHFDALLRFREALFQIQNGIDVEEISNLNVRAFSSQVRVGIVPELIHHKLFAQYAAEKRIEPTKESVDKARTAFANALGVKPERIQRISERIGGDAGLLFLRTPYVDAQDACLRQSVATNDLDTVTDGEIAQVKSRIEAWDKTADANNEKSRARLAQARSEIDAGGDFAKVTMKYAQVHPEYGKEWQTFELGEIPPEEDLFKWLSKAKIGEISEPLDLDDGLAIVKLVSMGKGDAPRGVALPDTYSLVRCTVYAYEYMEHLELPELKQEILKMKRTEAQRTLGMMLTSRAVLEYPNGTNFFGMAEVLQSDKQ